HLAAAFVEYGRRRGRDFGDLVFAGEELGDARAETPGFEGIDLGRLPDQFDRGLRIAVLHEGATHDQHPGGPGAGDEEPALWQRTVVAGRQEEVSPPFAP